MVAKRKLPILWDRMAKESLDQIYKYIFLDSHQNAQKVKKELIKLVGSLNDFPEKYSREEFLEAVTGNYRSVSKWNHKVIYEVTENSIIIVDIFQTRQHPSQIIKRIQSTKK